MASGMICNHFTPHFDLRLNVNKMLHSIASSCVFSPEVSLVQLYYYSRRKGGKQNVCVCGFASKEDHALKLHRYHVRFQRFIRTSDHGNPSKMPLLSQYIRYCYTLYLPKKIQFECFCLKKYIFLKSQDLVLNLFSYF